MNLRKDLVNDLIRITRMYYRTGKTDFLIELDKAENKLKQNNVWVTYVLISLIEDLAKFTQNSGIGTNKDIYKVLEVFGVIVE